MEDKSQFKELSTTQSIVMLLGAVMMVVGMGLYVFLIEQLIAAAVFLFGALVFATMQCMQVYHGRDITLHRLKSIQNLSDLCFVLAGVFMIDTAMTNVAISDPAGSHMMFLSNMFSNWQTYLQLVYNKWLILLLVGVILEVYTTHRIGHIINKGNKE